MNEQQVRKVARKNEKLIRPLYTTLISIVVVANLFVTFDTAAKNRQVKQVNEQIEKQIKKSKELQIMSEEIYKERLENNEQLNEIITRVNLRLDQLNQP